VAAEAQAAVTLTLKFQIFASVRPQMPGHLVGDLITDPLRRPAALLPMTGHPSTRLASNATSW
jgi:hypothetical protein